MTTRDRINIKQVRQNLADLKRERIDASHGDISSDAGWEKMGEIDHRILDQEAMEAQWQEQQAAEDLIPASISSWSLRQ